MTMEPCRGVGGAYVKDSMEVLRDAQEHQAGPRALLSHFVRRKRMDVSL